MINFYCIILSLFFIDYTLAIMCQNYYYHTLFGFFCVWSLVHCRYIKSGIIITLLLILHEIFIGISGVLLGSMYVAIAAGALSLQKLLDTSYLTTYLLVLSVYHALHIVMLDGLVASTPASGLYTLKRIFVNIGVSVLLTYIFRDKLDNRLKLRFPRGKSGLRTREAS